MTIAASRVMVSQHSFNFDRELCVAYFYYVTHERMKDKSGEQFCEPDEEALPLPEPIFGLPCHDGCVDGTDATLDLEKKKMICAA